MHACIIITTTQWRRATQFFRKIYLSLYWKVCVWVGVRDRTELQHIDPHSYGHKCILSRSPGLLNRGLGAQPLLGHVPHSSILSPIRLIFNCLIGCPEAPLCGVLVFSTASLLQLVWSPRDWTSCALSYIIVHRPPSSCGFYKSHSFNSSTVKLIYWYSSTGWICYLRRCISYFDSPAGSEVNIQYIWH